VTQLRAEILVGQRYRVLNRIAVDPFTETWRAFDTRLGRPVALQLVSDHARESSGAQASLRATAQASTSSTGQQDAYGRRIIDAGEDPIYGPFVVSELGSADAKRSLPTLDAVGRTMPADGLHLSPRGGQLALIALVGVVLVLLAAFVVATRVLGQVDQPRAGPAVSGTPQPPAGRLSGAPAPTLPPTPPTLQQAPPQPINQPTSAPAGQPIAAQPAPQQAGAPSTPQGGPPAGSPVDTIRQHYAFIDAKRYAEGYALMDAHLRSLNSAADYQSWFVDKISVKPISVDLVSQTETEAVVRAAVDTTDRVNGQSTTKRVSEEFVLHAEDGAWRIDQVSSL
jgi:hypothetical protein